jgi:hypothetical protein
MYVGRSAAKLFNLRVTSTARTVASLITASRDPPGTLGLFLGTLADGLRPAITGTPRMAPPGLRPPLAPRSSKKS